MKKQYRIIQHCFWSKNGKLEKQYYTIEELVPIISWLKWYKWKSVGETNYLDQDLIWITIKFTSVQEAEYYIDNVLKPNRPANQWTIRIFKTI